MGKVFEGQRAWILKEKILKMDMPSWIKYDRNENGEVIDLVVRRIPDLACHAPDAKIQFSPWTKGISKNAVRVDDLDLFGLDYRNVDNYSCVPFYVISRDGLEISTSYRRDSMKKLIIEFCYTMPLEVKALYKTLNRIGDYNRTRFFSEKDCAVNEVQKYVNGRKNFLEYDGRVETLNKMNQVKDIAELFIEDADVDMDEKNLFALDRYYEENGIFDEEIFRFVPKRKGSIFSPKLKNYKEKLANMAALYHCKDKVDKARLIENIFMCDYEFGKPICKSFLCCPDITKQLPFFLHHYYKKEDVKRLTGIYQLCIDSYNDFEFETILGFEGTEYEKKYKDLEMRYEDNIFRVLFETDPVIAEEMEFLVQLSKNYRAYTEEDYLEEADENYAFIEKLLN